MKQGKNDPCNCGSGKKFKHCCESKAGAHHAPSPIECNQLVALFNARRYAELEIRARSLTGQYPDSGFMWKLLGAALQMQGKNALIAFQKTSELMPDDAEAYFNLGVAQKSAGQLNAAEASYRRAVKINPDYAEAYSNLGNILKDLGQLNEAVTSFRCALKIKPHSANIHNNLGIALKDLGQTSSAIESYRKALEIKPDFTDAYYNLGNALKDLKQYEDAMGCYRKAMEINPKCDDAMLGIGSLQIIGGAMKEAEESITRLLEINPNNLEARFLLAGAKKTQHGDENLATLVATAEATRSGLSAIPYSKTITLHFTLGKCFDDLGDYGRAFTHFLEGNKLKRASFSYDSEQMTQRFNYVMQTLNKATITKLRGAGNSSEVPIFVLGMPRSGTTLTEQIIASHPDVYGAGELPDLQKIINREVGGKLGFPNNLTALDSATLTIWANDYVAGLHQRAPDARHITDKLPGNHWAVGLIHAMLPNARIIHVQRSPVDTCLSCFMTLFNSGQEFTYDLVELGRYYAGYSQLMDHWRKVLPADAFLDVRYEDIVADQEAMARHIIDYCGLKWNDACLDFHKHKRSVSTASMTQVRRPIYKSSVERWRPYEEFLGPLLDALGDLAPKRNL